MLVCKDEGYRDAIANDPDTSGIVKVRCCRVQSRRLLIAQLFQFLLKKNFDQNKFWEIIWTDPLLSAISADTGRFTPV